MNAVDERLLHFGRQYRLPENLPPGRHRTGELLEEVLDAALAAAEVVEHHVAHDAPTQARPPAQRGVHVCSADDALGDEVIDLPCQGRLQTVGHMAGHFLAQANGLLSEPRVEIRCALNGRLRSLGAANDLYQRDQVRWIERMANNAALGM